METFNLKSIVILVLIFQIGIICVQSSGNDKLITDEDIEANKNHTRELFEKGFHPHTAKSAFRFKFSSASEIKIFSLKNQKNEDELYLKYSKDEQKLIFHLHFNLGDKTSTWEIQFPGVDLEVEKWHFVVYWFGKKYFKLWSDCELRRSANGDLKTEIEIPEGLHKSFAEAELLLGDSKDIEYNQLTEFIVHPIRGFDYFYESRLTCKYEFNKTEPQIYINDNDKEGVYYPMEDFVNASQKFNTPFVYYQLKKSTVHDVSEYFEDGIDIDHGFEMMYRITKFPVSDYPYYFIHLKNNAQGRISFSLDGKPNLLGLSCSINTKHVNTGFRADQMYNNDWHKLKYELKDGFMSIWLDDELLEDFKGSKHIDLKFGKPDKQFLWYDTFLHILEPEFVLHKEPTLHIRTMKFYGKAITTNNTEVLLEPDKKEDDGVFDSFVKVLGRALG